MELIAQINGAVNSFVWGAPMLILLIMPVFSSDRTE